MVFIVQRAIPLQSSFCACTQSAHLTYNSMPETNYAFAWCHSKESKTETQTSTANILMVAQLILGRHTRRLIRKAWYIKLEQMKLLPNALQMEVSKGGMKLMQILHPFVSLGSSILLGFGTGVGLHNLVQWRPSSVWRPVAPLARRMPSYVGVR